MNYRHAFHAGNFADLLKHAVLSELLAALTARPAPLTVIDTHAGAGHYDLHGDAAQRTGESGSGVARLMADAAAPPVFDAVKTAVRRANVAGVRHYPGSPLIIAAALRVRDTLIACEIRADDHAMLKSALPREAGAEALRRDGWETAVNRTAKPPASTLVLIDPPFERGDDAAMAAATTGRILTRNRAATIAIWAPIKDLAGFDAFIGDIEEAASGRSILVVEARLRPLDDPTRLNGCAMVVINPTSGLETAAAEAASWIAVAPGGAGRCWWAAGGR